MNRVWVLVVFRVLRSTRCYRLNVEYRTRNVERRSQRVRKGIHTSTFDTRCAIFDLAALRVQALRTGVLADQIVSFGRYDLGGHKRSRTEPASDHVGRAV